MVHFVVYTAKQIFLIEEFRKSMHHTIILFQFDLKPFMDKLIKMIFNLLLSISEILLVLLELHFDVTSYCIKLIWKLIPLWFLKEVFTYSNL